MTKKESYYEYKDSRGTHIIDFGEGLAKYKDKKLGIEIDFLLGFKDNTWKLWIGKIGAISYDDDPWVDLDCDNFKDAILKCLDYTADFIEVVKENKDNWVQFYI